MVGYKDLFNISNSNMNYFNKSSSHRGKKRRVLRLLVAKRIVHDDAVDDDMPALISDDDDSDDDIDPNSVNYEIVASVALQSTDTVEVYSNSETDECVSEVDDNDDDDDDYVPSDLFMESDVDDDDDNNDGASFSNGSAAHELKKAKIRDELMQSNLISFLGSKLSNKSSSSISTLLKRSIDFLCWFSNQEEERWTGLDALKLLQVFIVKRSDLLPDYYTYLSDVLLLKASTVMNYNEDFYSLVKWFTLYRENRFTVCRVHSSALFIVRDIVTTMRKTYAKLRKIDRSNEANSIEELIELRKWPSRGLNELYDAVAKERDWLETVIASLKSGVQLTRGMYNLFLQLLSASAYVSSPQGRIGSIEELTMGQLLSLLNSPDDYVLSDKFKTSASFGYQPVTGAPIFLDHLRVYLRYFRYIFIYIYIVILHYNIISREFDRRKESISDSEPAFIGFHGRPVCIGKLLTKFFRRTLSLHITSNTIRSLVETSTDELCLKGVINKTAKAAVANINGHNSATVKKYYLKRHRGEDVSNSRKVFKKLVPSADIDSNSSDGESVVDDDDSIGTPSGRVTAAKRTSIVDDANVEFQQSDEEDEYDGEYRRGGHHADVACVHKYRSSPNKRIPWSAAEVSFVGEWCGRNSTCTNVIAQCRKYILAHPEVKRIFHPSHIIDSGRLRHGADAYVKKMKDREDMKYR
jgi:hypothetical protein